MDRVLGGDKQKKRALLLGIEGRERTEQIPGKRCSLPGEAAGKEGNGVSEEGPLWGQAQRVQTCYVWPTETGGWEGFMSPMKGGLHDRYEDALLRCAAPRCVQQKTHFPSKRLPSCKAVLGWQPTTDGSYRLYSAFGPSL